MLNRERSGLHYISCNPGVEHTFRHKRADSPVWHETNHAKINNFYQMIINLTTLFDYK